MPRSRATQASTQRSERTVSVSDDDDDDDTYAPSQSGATSSGQNMSAKQFDVNVSDIINYLLVADAKKASLKRSDIIKHALKDNAKEFSAVMKIVKKKLSDIFGLELQELPGKKGQFILLNQLEVNPVNPHIVWSDKDNSRNGLLTIILAMIFMNGNVLAESELWPALTKLGLDIELPHNEFGDLKKLVTREFVRQLYLEYKRIPNSDPATFEFCWGPRAHAEASKKDVLGMVCEIYGTAKPEDFTEQHEDALAEEAADKP